MHVEWSQVNEYIVLFPGSSALGYRKATRHQPLANREISRTRYAAAADPGKQGCAASLEYYHRPAHDVAMLQPRTLARVYLAVDGRTEKDLKLAAA